MKLNKQQLNRMYYTTGSIDGVIYEIKTTKNGGAVSQNNVNLNEFIPSIRITKTERVVEGATPQVVNDKFYLDSYIEDGDIWTFRSGDDAVKKNRSNDTLIVYALNEARRELQNYIANNPSVTAETILKNNKTGVPSWLFKESDGDAKYTITIDNISDSDKLDLTNIVSTTKNAIITQLTEEFEAKQVAETAAFQTNMERKQNEFNAKIARDAALFIQLLEKKFNIILSDDNGGGCQECVVDRDFDHVEDNPCYNDSDNDGYDDIY